MKMQIFATPYKYNACKCHYKLVSELKYLMMFYLHPFFPPPSHRKHRRDRAVRPGAVWLGDPVRRPDQDAEAGSQVPLQEVLWDMWGETWAGLGGANRESGTSTRSTVGHVRWDMGRAGWGKQGVRYLYKKYCGTCEVRSHSTSCRGTWLPVCPTQPRPCLTSHVPQYFL